MQVYTFTILFASVALALPADSLPRRTDFYLPCNTDLSATAECCSGSSANILGLADVNCAADQSAISRQTPTSAKDFVTICAAKGQEAKCCLTVALTTGVKCQNPPGT
ncbi:fungal hydrophobin like protein [Zymoseptoria brevis]|uniref:Fungal hydrophobin like protein n=1 Tax=Zymoseptoria brevis TaxID=1047168 RepID=A0A0F4GZS2_9PEZI|nr:fungal hydrophobin like protein [Zymoseptoria brevis]